MQRSDGITDSPRSMAPMSRAEAGAAAPYLAQNLVWGLLARARGVAARVCSFVAVWCSTTLLRRRFPRSRTSRRPSRASSRHCGQLYPPAAGQDCSSGGIASRQRTLLSQPQICSGGRLLRRRSEQSWCTCGVANDLRKTSAYGLRSSANVETSSLHREGPFDE